MNYFIVLLISLILICVLKFCSKKSEAFVNSAPVNYKVTRKNPNYKKACTEKLILSRPNKCFSCEREILKNYGKDYLNYAFPGKCFACEKESKNPIHEGPTKCFSCKN